MIIILIQIKIGKKFWNKQRVNHFGELIVGSNLSNGLRLINIIRVGI